MKLLMADDDVFSCKLLERILASSYELVMAEDGAEAWQLNVRTAESARSACNLYSILLSN